MAQWIPARTNPHPPLQSIAASGHYEFVKPAGANGFALSVDQTVNVTFDGTVATAANGFPVDPTKNNVVTAGMIPVTPLNQVSVYNKAASAANVSIAWFEDTEI